MATLADYGPEVRAEVKQVREVVAALHEQLVKWNLVVWTAGNVSQRLRTADLMVIKPSGLRYEYLTPSSMVVCDLDGNVVDGSESPSSDTASHAYIYRHMPDVYGVVHTHSTYATAVGGDGPEHSVRSDDDGRRVRRSGSGGAVPSDRFRGDRRGRGRDAQGVSEVPGCADAEPWSVHGRQGRGGRGEGGGDDGGGGPYDVGGSSVG